MHDSDMYALIMVWKTRHKNNPFQKLQSATNFISKKYFIFALLSSGINFLTCSRQNQYAKKKLKTEDKIAEKRGKKLPRKQN